MSDTPTLLTLLGFTPFERRSFEAFFELGRVQGPGYEFTLDLWRAECAIADADDEAAMSRLMHAGLIGRSVLLGNTPHAGAALQLPRPINLLLVMRALDTMIGARPRTATRLASIPEEGEPQPKRSRAVQTARADAAPGSPAAAPAATAATAATELPAPTADLEATAPIDPAPASDGRQIQRVLDELAFRTATLPPNLDARAMAAQPAQPAQPTPGAGRGSRALMRHDPLAPGAARSHSPRTLPMEHILVVDNDAATLRLVAVQLQRFGFQMHLAGHSDDAIRLLRRRFHDYVFLDPALPGLDALLVCRLARQAAPPDEHRATTVVLLADPNASSEPLQRALPAADACLRKPLDQHALLKLVGEREVARYAYADTARTTTLI